MKYTCDVPGLEDNWIEIEDKWTRRETKELDGIQDERYFEVLRAKTISCHLVDDDGNVITKPEGITDDAFDAFDEAILGFLGGVLYHEVRRRRNLGNVSARPSPNGTEAKK